MTHTLHREGKTEDLANDYVVLAITEPGLNTKGARQRFKKICNIFSESNPVNMGVLSPKKEPITTLRGNTIEEIREALADFSVLHAVYSDKRNLKSVLDKLKSEDLGISIVVSGLFEEISKLLGYDTKPPFFHTINLSMGIHGKTDELPPEDVRTLTTMCGHGMVSSNLVCNRLDRIQSGRMTTAEAASELGKQCVCGIFNKSRAQYLLEHVVKKKSS